MTLQFVDVELPFSRGLSGKEAQKISEGPLLLENANFDEVGAINKRSAYTPISASAAGEYSRAIISRGDFSLAYRVGPSNMAQLTAYSPLRSSWGNGSSLCPHQNARVTADKALFAGSLSRTSLRALDRCVGPAGSNREFYLYQEFAAATTFDQTYLVTKDTVTGNTLDVSPQAVDAVSPRLLKVGTWGFLFVWRQYTAGLAEVRYCKRTAAATVWGGFYTTATSGAVGIPWDCCFWKGNEIAIAWLDAANHVNITTWDVSTDLQVGTVDTGVAAAPESCLSIFSDEDPTSPKISVVFELASTHYVQVTTYDKDLVQTVAPLNVYSLGATEFMRQCSMSIKPSAAANVLCYAFSWDGTISAAHTIVGEYNYSTGALVSTQSLFPWGRLASRLCTIGKEAYFWLSNEQQYSGFGTNAQPGCFLVTRSLMDGTRRFYTVAAALYGDAHETYINHSYDLGKLPNLTAETLDSDLRAFNLVWAFPVSTDSSSSKVFGAGVSVAFNQLMQDVKIDRSHLLTGGVVYALGNTTAHENGFLLYPEIFALTATGAGGSMSDGTYSVLVVAEFVDENGLLHRSAPSLPKQVTLAAGGAAQRILVEIKTQNWGNPYKFTAMRYHVYRTQNGGSIYYYAGGYVNSAPTQTVCQTYASASDATIAANQTLYTTGSPAVVESIAPPAAWSLTKSSDRVFCLSAEDRHEVWYSKPKEEGIAVEFSDLQIVRFPEPLEAIAYFEARLYGFSRDRIYMVVGEGPDATGQGGQFSLPQLVSSVTGCSNPFSIVETPQGLMFQSQMSVHPLPALAPSATGSESAGIWLLSGQGLTPVLPPDDFSFYPISSAVNVPKKSQVVFTLWGYSAANALLVYDYLTGQWSTHLVAEAGTRYPFGCAVSGLHQFVSGDYWYAQASTFSATDVLKVRTPWIKPGGMVSGFGRVRWVYLLGTYKSAHTLNVKVYYDYDDSSAAETITATISAAQTPYLYRFKPGRQRCNAIMLEIYDSSPSGTNESFSLDGLLLNIGRKPRQVLSAARTL
jgi:hypothetical protein